jgi:hypothetical protein
MIDKWLYNFFGSIDTFFECIENLFKKYMRDTKLLEKHSQEIQQKKKKLNYL